MKVSGLVQSGEVVPVKAQALALKLEMGQLLTARVTQLLESGRGLLQLLDGSELSFAKGAGITEGEQLRLQVVRTGAEIALRVVASDSGVAAKLADVTERNLLKAPALFTKLLQFSGSSELPAAKESFSQPAPSGQPGAASLPAPAANALSSAPATLGTAVAARPGVALPAVQPGVQPAAPSPLGEQGPSLQHLAATIPKVGVPLEGAGGWRLPANLMKTASGETLNDILRSTLPSLSLDDLLQGDTRELAKLFTAKGGSPALPGEVIQRLRVAAESLQMVKGGGQEDPAVKEAVRQAGGEFVVLHEAKQSLLRLGDLVASQELMPRGQSVADGSAFLGYRVFWLPEGGMGEVVWNREKEGQGRDGAENKEGFSVLLSLQMSRLGPVQARIALGENYLNVAISAGREESLDSLRQDIGELRQGLLQAELPLRTLNLGKLNEQGMLEERQNALGFAGGLRVEA